MEASREMISRFESLLVHIAQPLITTTGNENQYLVGALAMLSLLNLVGAFYYFSKSAQKMAMLHLVVQFVLSIYFF
jgi:hypothetical protein